MIYDAYGRPIRKLRLYGFGRVPQSEPPVLVAPRYSESGCADALGFAEFATEEPDEGGELLEIECKEDIP